jgi:glycosyltransferase involved in cell wall biosynthesis
MIKNLRILFKIIPKKTLISIVNNILIFVFLNRWLRNRQINDGPITVVGMLRSNSGLGQAVRLTLAALKKMKFQVTCFDVSYLYSAHKFNIRLPKVISSNEGGVIIVQNSPIHLPIILFLLGRRRVARKKIIGYFVWELEELPRSFILTSKLVDEIWVPSQFAAKSFAKIKNVPIIRVVPHPLKILKSKYNFSLPSHIAKYPKKILNISTLGSQFQRKNVLGTIDVFKQKYSKSLDVCLILKVSGSNLLHKKFLEQNIVGEDNIFIIDRNLSESQLYGLIQSVDVLVSLHRSEGFGLCIAEAMMLKTPIVATNWSANVEFFQDKRFLVDCKMINVNGPEELSGYNYIVEPKWAEPDLKDAARKIDVLVANGQVASRYALSSYKSIISFLNSSGSFYNVVPKALTKK